MDGNVAKSYLFFYTGGFKAILVALPFPTMRAIKVILAFGAFEAALLVAVPGERYLGPLTPSGNRPLYKVVSTINQQHFYPNFLGSCGEYKFWRTKRKTDVMKCPQKAHI